MDSEALRTALRAHPFRFFTICLADGRSFEVPHPEFAAMSRRNVHVVREDGLFSILDVRLISSLDFNAERSDAGQSGDGNR